MRTFQRIVVQLGVAVAIIVSTGIAWGQRLDFQSPESRIEDWRNGFQRFAERHPDLTSEQLAALHSLADIDDAAFFATSLDRERRDVLAERLGELGRVLPYSEYLRLVRSFGDLRLWFIANGLASQAEAAVPSCNCTYSWHCQSGTCRDVACELNGTTHTGVCSGASEEQAE